MLTSNINKFLPMILTLSTPASAKYTSAFTPTSGSVAFNQSKLVWYMSEKTWEYEGLRNIGGLSFASVTNMLTLQIELDNFSSVVSSGERVNILE